MLFSMDAPEWRNWQTRWTQNPVVLSTVWVRPPPPGPNFLAPQIQDSLARLTPVGAALRPPKWNAGGGSISAPKFTCGAVVLTHVPENARFCCGAKSRRVHELGGTPFGARIAQRLLGLCCPEGCNAEQATMRFSTTPSIPPKDSPEMHYVPRRVAQKNTDSF